MKRYIFQIFLLGLGLVLASCSTSQPAGQTVGERRQPGADTIEVQNALTLVRLPRSGCRA
ncbi:MAG: hypothetical protein H6559_10350 [Lewinellaceae bacterium]|nr:hypothetical protein [Lewinellaceae bacterium]